MTARGDWCVSRGFNSEDLYCRAKRLVLKQEDYTLRGKQVDVFDYVLDRANANEQVLALIHGKWGTDKTRTTNAILAGLKRIGVYAKCTGSTGVAATNYVGGSTAHNLFGISPKKTLAFIETLKGRMKKITNRLGRATFLICDEISMYSTTLFNQMNTILQTALHNNRPFGGLSVILVGDFYQKKVPRSTPLHHALYYMYHGKAHHQKRVDKAAAILFEKFRRFELESGAWGRQGKCDVLTSILDRLRTAERATTSCISREAVAPPFGCLFAPESIFENGIIWWGAWCVERVRVGVALGNGARLRYYPPVRCFAY